MSTHLHLDMVSSDILCNLDFRISYDFTRSGHIFSHHPSPPYLVFQVQHILLSPYAFTSVDPGQYLCLSVPFPLSLFTYFPQRAYPFTVRFIHACEYPFIHSGVVVSLELPKPLSSRLAPWMRGFLLLHIQVLYSMDTHTGISICGLPLWIQGNACVYPFLFLCVFLYIYLNMHIHLQLPEMSVVPEYVYPLIFSLWCDGLSGYPNRVLLFIVTIGECCT